MYIHKTALMCKKIWYMGSVGYYVDSVNITHRGHHWSCLIHSVVIITLSITALIARFMGPTWCPSGAGRTQVGPMLAPWTLLSGCRCFVHLDNLIFHVAQTLWHHFFFISIVFFCLCQAHYGWKSASLMKLGAFDFLLQSENESKRFFSSYYSYINYHDMAFHVSACYESRGRNASAQVIIRLMGYILRDTNVPWMWVTFIILVWPSDSIW